MLTLLMIIFTQDHSILAQTSPLPGATQYEYEITQNGILGTQNVLDTSGNYIKDLTFNVMLNPSRTTTVRARALVNAQWTDWTPPSAEFVPGPLAGDVDHNGCVGGSDYLILAAHYNQCVP